MHVHAGAIGDLSEQPAWMLRHANRPRCRRIRRGAELAKVAAIAEARTFTRQSHLELRICDGDGEGFDKGSAHGAVDRIEPQLAHHANAQHPVGESGVNASGFSCRTGLSCAARGEPSCEFRTGEQG